jgi:hypothetical protein
MHSLGFSPFGVISRLREHLSHLGNPLGLRLVSRFLLFRRIGAPFPLRPGGQDCLAAAFSFIQFF